MVASGGNLYLQKSEPISPSCKEFDSEIQEISPSFVKIYNQALAAEELNLSEIAGMGYRKSLEFLIKDFAYLYTRKMVKALNQWR